MSLKQKLEEDLKKTIKAGEALKVSVLRMALAAIHNKEIQLLKKTEGLSDEETCEVLRQEVKRRKDAALEFEKGGRKELALKEKEELEILSPYLPREMSEEDLERILREGIREAGAEGIKDFGKVMKVVMPILKGRASGDRISVVLKKLLAG
jgi:uncharacterized protein YqeY